MPLASRIRSSIRSVFGWRWAVPVIVILALGLCSTSLTSGLAADDYFHRLVLTKSTELEGVHADPMDLFVFSSGDPEVGRAQIDSGMIAWWADPATALAYFRPLSSLSHWFDYQLFPDSPLWMHVHNLLWFALGLVALSRVYRRFQTPAWAAALALLLFGIDDAHGFVISWIANRNALIALALGLPVLLFHDTWRKSGARSSLALALVLLAVALLAGESTTAVCAYLFAYAVCLDRGRLAERLITLVPYAVVVVVWRTMYAVLGYGTRDSGLAVDPSGDPLFYVRAVLDRWPALMLGQFGFPASDIWEFYPIVASWLPLLMYGVALGVVAGIVWLTLPLLRSNPVARFWALGAAIAALPACSQVPSDRLLLYVGVGAMGLLAQFFAAMVDRDAALYATAARRWSTYLAGGFLVLLHVPYAAWGLPLRSRGPADVTRMLAKADDTVPSEADIADKTVVLVNPPADAFAGYLTMRRAAEGRPRPEHLRWLATGSSPLVVTRLDERSLQVEAEDGFMSLKSEWMQRSPSNPMPVGYSLELTGMVVTVVASMPDGRPRTAEFRFDAPLDARSFVWLRWDDQRGLVPFQLPEVGASERLPAVDFFVLRE